MRLSRLPCLLPLSIFPLTSPLWAFPSVGFQEQTFNRCPNSFAFNEGRTQRGIFRLVGVPPTYRKGVSYPITVVLRKSDHSCWKFGLSARYSTSTEQAGQLVPVDPMTQVKENREIQYIEHTSTGNREGKVDGSVTFQFKWIALDLSGGPAFFNAAVNAANTSGDYTYYGSGL